MKALWVTLASVFICSAATATEQEDITRAHLPKIDAEVEWILGDKTPKRATGNQAWFYGNKFTFVYNTGSPANSADISVGYFLYRTYDMYCALKKQKAFCLGSKLHVTFSMKGSEADAGRTVYVRTAKGSFASNYLQEARRRFFEHLEAIGGNVPDRNRVYALLDADKILRIRTDMVVTFDDAGNGNTAWKKFFYSREVLARAAKVLGNIVGFDLKSRSTIRSTSLYKDKSQLPHLKRAQSGSGGSKIQTVVSGPGTTSSSGLSWVGKNYRPHFAMRSRYNDWSSTAKYATASAYDNTAKIYLHELGHNMGLDHCGKNQKTLCTDNFFNLNDGRSTLLNYLKQVGGVKVTYAF
ncbi:zinc-dependent metalloprotease family protein [Bdellovibrio bacteriovorus]|uniref:zinc-dependent metalloprotease family protein n=1 Tax=Bdellovibrio bacteriovorus TaxID=959 RepID=UPI0002D38635|nr:zinc-dependent metalloprotease family protein [Bdellovibrio bacteriovorus]